MRVTATNAPRIENAAEHLHQIDDLLARVRGHQQRLNFRSQRSSQQHVRAHVQRSAIRPLVRVASFSYRWNCALKTPMRAASGFEMAPLKGAEGIVMPAYLGAGRKIQPEGKLPQLHLWHRSSFGWITASSLRQSVQSKI
jgi:hypothetical protein